MHSKADPCREPENTARRKVGMVMLAPKVGNCSMEIAPDSDAEPRSGQFLLSEPFLQDPWFGRKTVFLCDHDDHGTVGLVLDHASGRQLSDVFPDAAEWGLDQEVHVGGPVHQDSLFFLHRLGDRVGNSMPVVPGLWLGGDLEDVQSAMSEVGHPAVPIRFFMGYSGWTAGQLSSEIRQRSWYVHDVSLEEKIHLVMDASPGFLWKKLLSQKGPSFSRIADLPLDPGLN